MEQKRPFAEFQASLYPVMTFVLPLLSFGVTDLHYNKLYLTVKTGHNMNDGISELQTNSITTPPQLFFSISTQLRYGPIIYVFIFLLLMAMIAILHSFRTHQLVLAAIQQEQSDVAITAITNHIQHLHEDLESLAQRFDLIGSSPDLQQTILTSILRHNADTSRAVLLDTSGQSLMAYPSNPSFTPAAGQHIEQALAQSNSGYSLILNVAANQPQLMVMTPLFGPGNIRQGTLLLQTDLKFLQEILTTKKHEMSGYVYLLDRTQNMLIYTENGALVIDPSAQSLITNLMADNTRRTSIWSQIVRQSVYTGLSGRQVLRQVTAVPIINADLVVEIPLSEAYSPILSMIGTMSLILLIAIAGAIGMGVYFSREVSAPLNQLATAAAQISEGNLDVHLPVYSRNELGLLAITFNHMITQFKEMVNNLEKSVQERTSTINRRSLQIQAAAETARDATAAYGLTELLERAVNLVPSRFGYYHAGIFLVDEGNEYAVLRAATGPIGQAMLQRKHRLRIGKEGIVGRVVQTGQAYITSDINQDTVYWSNPLLPETRSEMALPLKVGDHVIGAMNVQSKDVAAFEKEDITILQILTDQLAVAIEKVHLFEKTQAMLTERLHTIVSNIPLILFAFDRQGTITLIEGKGLAILGVDKIQFTGQSVFEVLRREPEILTDIRHALQGQSLSTTVRFRGFTWDVRYIPLFDDEREVSGAIGVASDITERRRAEESLQEKERQLRQIIDLVPHLIFARDLEGRYLLVNQAVATTYNTTVQTITGSFSSDWHPVAAELAGFLRDDKEVIVSKQAKAIPEEVFTDAFGHKHTLQTSKIPLDWAGGMETAVLGVSVDITQRKQAEEALRQAQKLESLGILAGGVAHDFNNLLVAILGQTSLALVRLSKEDPAYQAIEKATRAAERAAELTRQLLAYSGRGHFEIQLLNLNLLIQENLHLFEVAVPKNIYLQSQLTIPLPLIEADAGQMQQIIMNLILNGAEAIGDIAGTVMVTTDIQEVHASDKQLWQYTGEPLASGSYVSLEVHDSGYGMDEATVARIFDPFFSTKKAGRGLGLAAVLGIVRGHHGGICVYSEVGKGTTFKVLFPIVSQEVATQLHNENESMYLERSGLILIIDDEQAVRETAVDILEAEGFTTISAANGQDGLSIYVERMSDAPVILLDLSMPGLSGEETFRRLCQLNPKARVILSSGYNEFEATHRFTGKGLAGFLQKPYSAQQLIAAIKKCIDGG